jgi:hypothetical protein
MIHARNGRQADKKLCVLVAFFEKLSCSIYLCKDIYSSIHEKYLLSIYRTWNNFKAIYY